MNESIRDSWACRLLVTGYTLQYLEKYGMEYLGKVIRKIFNILLASSRKLALQTEDRIVEKIKNNPDMYTSRSIYPKNIFSNQYSMSYFVPAIFSILNTPDYSTLNNIRILGAVNIVYLSILLLNQT